MEEIKTEIGNEEKVTYEPMPVKVADVLVIEVGSKKAKKVVCHCLHPKGELPLQISAVKYELKGKLETVGLWFNLDSKGLIRKDCALAVLLRHTNCKTPFELIGKELATTTDGVYLCFKAY